MIKIAFIIEGSISIGFGHLKRIIPIAQFLIKRKNIKIFFVVNNSLINKQIKKLGFKSYLTSSVNIEKMNLETIVKIFQKEKPNITVIDVKSEHEPTKIIKLLRKKNNKIKIVLIDNGTKARLYADKNIYPIPQKLVADLDWGGYEGEILSGLQFFPLRKEFTQAKKNKGKKNSIIITFGGTDPNNLSLLTMKALVKCNKKIKVIIGPGFKHRKSLLSFASKHRNIFRVYEEPKNISQIIGSSSVAITAFGISIYEICYLRIPVIVIGNYKNELRSAKILEELGYCHYLGYYKNVSQEHIQKSIGLIGKKPKFVSQLNQFGISNLAQAILSFKQQVVINLGAGLGQLELIKKLREMKIKILSVDRNPNSIGFKYSFDKLVISTYHTKKILVSLKRKENIYEYLGVMTKASGIPNIAAGMIASYYHLPGIKFYALQHLIYKNKLNDFAKKMNEPMLKYLNLNKLCVEDKLKNHKFLYPIIMKPALAEVGKREVRLIRDYLEFKKYFYKCRKKSLNKVVCIQEYINGDNVNSLTIIYKSKIYFSVLVDEINCLEDNSFIGLGIKAPSKYEKGLIEQKIGKIVKKVIRRLNLTEGFLSLSFIVNKEKKIPNLIEASTDLFGDLVVDKLLVKLFPGFDFMRAIIEILTSQKPPPFNLNVKNISKPFSVFYPK